MLEVDSVDAICECCVLIQTNGRNIRLPGIMCDILAKLIAIYIQRSYM